MFASIICSHTSYIIMADSIRNLTLTDGIIATESEVTFGVLNGAQNITSQGFKSIKCDSECNGIEYRNSKFRDYIRPQYNDDNSTNSRD